MIVIPSAKKSEYVTYEWAFALGARKPAIPILRKSTPLHPRLEDLQYLDFSKGYQWEKLVDELKQIQNTPVSPAVPKPAQQTSTIRVPEDAPPYLKQAVVALDSASAAERLEATKTLAEINLPEARKALVAALEHPVRDVRASATLELVSIGDTSAVRTLIDRLKANDINYRDQLLTSWALERTGTPEALAAVEEWRKAQQQNKTQS